MKKFLLLYGGKSFEHDISCESAKNIINALKEGKYNFDQIYISKENEWFLIKEGDKVEIFNIIEFLKKYDFIFPIMHGAYGEDGRIQSFLELFNIKYIGSNSFSSMIAMDKYFTKLIIEKTDIKQVPYFIMMKDDKIPKSIEYPVIVKPANGGSSIGISVASNINDLKKAVKEAFLYDNKVLIEKFIEARELECGILEDKKIIVGDVGEIKHNHKFYDFDAKYNDKSETIIPAKINKKLTKTIQQTAKKIFQILNLKDFARVDFLYDEKNDVLYFNEVNTIPGFTNISMFPLLFKSKKMDYTDVVLKLIEK